MKEKYMKYALKEAKKAFLKNEVPVGAVIVKNNKIIAKAYNKKITTTNVFDHAEIIALRKATKKLGDWRLNDCDMYITLEPCPMCASAIQQSRLNSIYIGTKSNIDSNQQIMTSILNNPQFNHQVKINYSYDNECSQLLSVFFENKRR